MPSKVVQSLSLVLLVNAVLVAGVPDGDRCFSSPCLHDGTCYSNYNNGVMCKCPPCYSGQFCEENLCRQISKGTLAVRFILLIITFLLGMASILMFFYRVKVISNEKIIEPQEIAGTGLSSSVMTKVKGKDVLVVDSRASITDSLCSMVYAASTGGSKSSVVADPNEVLRERVINWYQRNKKNPLMATTTAEKPKRRHPPWDEVEMRKHGLVNRHCNRVFYPDCPSNPDTIEVSDYAASNQVAGSTASGTANDYGLITYGQTADSTSFASSTPLASSTPRKSSREPSGAESVVSGSTAKSGPTLASTSREGVTFNLSSHNTQSTQQSTNPSHSVYVDANLQH